MKRLLWILPLTVLFQLPLKAQTKVGIKVSPTFIINRMANAPDSVNLGVTTVGFRPIIGLFVDMALSENYFFQIGANYISKPLTLTINNQDQLTQEKKYTLQYLQLPLTLKLLTNEVSLDKRIYFQIGTQADIQLSKEEEKQDLEIIKSFNPLSFTLYIGAGMEFQMGPHTTIIAGLSYNRGLTNIVKNDVYNNTLSLKNDLLSIDIGVKF